MDNIAPVNPLELWSKALESLQKDFDSQLFDRWLKPIKIKELRENEVVLTVRDDFFKTWVVDHYQDKIYSSLKNLLNDPNISIRFDIEDEILLKSEPSQPSASPPKSTFSQVFSSAFSQSEIILNHKYTFDSFVVGPSNRFAHAASMAVAESPAKSYNPLFIYGPVGLGKTHLMQAIGQEVLRRNKDTKVLYITSEKFTNQLINAIKTGTTVKFREKYRSVDCLLIDDIHFIAGKEATMEEFFNTFNTLYDSHKQIVVSSDKPPKDINNLEERLVSRFEWGLVTDIQPPDFETRTAILRKKAEREGLYIPDSVTFFIADKIKSNIRELEGALIRVVAYSKLVGKEVDEIVAQDVLKDLIVENQKKITVDLIQRKVAEYFEMRPSDMTAKRRSKSVAYPRHIAMYLSRELTSLSFPELGEHFGGRDHTTILHACDKLKKDIKKDPKTRSLMDKLIVEIKK